MQRFNNNNFSGRGGFGGRGRGRGGFGAGVFGGGVGVAPVQCFSCGARAFLASRGCSACGRPGNAVGGGPLVPAGQMVRRAQVSGGAERQACGVCRLGKVCPHVGGGSSVAVARAPRVQRVHGGPVSTVRQGLDGSAGGVEVRRFKSGLQKMWAGAKFALKDDPDEKVKDKNQWLKYQCYTVESLLRGAIETTAKVDVESVEVTLRSNTLVGKGIVVVALAGMTEEKGLGLDAIEEIAGARRFTLDQLRDQVVRVSFKITEDLDGQIKPVGVLGKRPRVVIRVVATKDCIEETVASLTYKVKVSAVVGRGASQLA